MARVRITIRLPDRYWIQAAPGGKHAARAGQPSVIVVAAGAVLVAVVVLMPVVLLCTAWVYRVLWGRSSTAALKSDPALY